METKETGSVWQQFTGPNAGYVEELYERFLRDPLSVDEETREWFQIYGMPVQSQNHVHPRDGEKGERALLREMNQGSFVMEYAHTASGEEQDWLEQMLMTSRAKRRPDLRRETLMRLLEVDEFEKFLQRAFPGQKRFSLEGLDMLVPMVDELVKQAASSGIKTVMMGMAHRGRLNVLAHVLGKPYADIFSEFHMAPNKDLVPSEGSLGINYGWTGDVKYHLGAHRDLREDDIREVRIVLAHNPSHLEFVDPVVEGYARAVQDGRDQAGQPAFHQDEAMAMLVHGDAAFPGEGVVAETLNLSRLDGYQTGGTIHIIANNQLGFTAEAHEGRSTHYASDLAKGFEIPVVHVDADDPDACLFAVQMAFAYRQRFHRDFLIDLVGYRRWGHNEMDDPFVTQPQMYERITAHLTVREIYGERLFKDGVVTNEELELASERIKNKLTEAFAVVKQGETRQVAPADSNFFVTQVDRVSSVSREQLQEMNEALLHYPSSFAVYKKLEKILERRRTVFSENGSVDFAHAETLAFAAILAAGTPIRISGQDSQRGTFGQRNLVLHDRNVSQTHCPLQHLPHAKASFAVYNSPLSEVGVMGFEYGYTIQAPETLVIWEAQFGDFANAGQVIIDQFLSSGRSKWLQSSGLVLLLPHGYEGQGPEHSSARLERFLQLSAEDNWRVVHPTTAAQYFHLLRSQAAVLRVDPRPLIVMTPKSLLRHPQAQSTVSELTEGMFQPVLHRFSENREGVTQLVLCSGKVAIDLEQMLSTLESSGEIALARVEQLYPFPVSALRDIIRSYPHLRQIVWAQEEPKNMGAWSFVAARLPEVSSKDILIRYAGRPDRASPAEGMAGMHDYFQRQVVEKALRVSPIQ